MVDDSGDRSEDGVEQLPNRSPSAMQAVYDDIADHFAKTRANPWPEVEAFVEEELPDRPTPGLGLDLGCANGRHSELLAGTCERVVGIDISRQLLFEARERLGTELRVSLLQGDALAVPLEANVVDLAVYIATVHHLPDRETRRASLAELARVLASDGIALVSAWSTEHQRFDAPVGQETGFDTTVDWTLPGGETIPRYYHIYAQPEFEHDLVAGGFAIESSKLSSGNCYARVRVK